jgi:hypothetical protein
MKYPRLFVLSVTFVTAFALLSIACGSVRQAAERQKKQNDLMQIALAYINYCEAKGKGPANADDLLPYIENDPVLLQKMKNDYTIIWGVELNKPAQFENGMSFTILAYENAAPTSGGVVVMCDAAPKIMTASEFNAAPKAKPGGGKK